MQTQTQAQNYKDDSLKQPFTAHIDELRRRVTWSVLSLLAGGVVGYFIHETIFRILIKPLNMPLFYTSPTGGIDFLIKVCFFFGTLCATPVVIYHLLKFLEPAVPDPMHQRINKTMIVSALLMLAGASFAYFVSLPAALHFLGEFGAVGVEALINANDYFSFVLVYIAGFAILFQLPLILLFINRIKPFKPGDMMGFQKYVVLLSFIAAAIITPTPDLFNQVLMAVPVILLYQFSAIIIWATRRRKERVARRTSRAAAKEVKPEVSTIPMVAHHQQAPKEVPKPVIIRPEPRFQPTRRQFDDWTDSYRYKTFKMPTTSVDGLLNPASKRTAVQGGHFLDLRMAG